MLRRTFLHRSAALACAPFAVGPARAAGTSERLPDEVAQRLPNARFSGSGRLRYFGLAVYDAQLWTAEGFKAQDYTRHALALSLTYLRAFKGNDIAKRSLQEISRKGDVSAETARLWLIQLRDLLPDVQTGERLTGLYQPGGAVQFWHQGRSLGAIGDPQFSQRFFGIWLAPDTQEPALRKALLAHSPP